MSIINKIKVGNTYYDIEQGIKVTGTVSGDKVSFINSAINDNVTLDGPYIKGALLGLADVSYSGTTVTYTLSSSDGDGKDAYIWVRG